MGIRYILYLVFRVLFTIVPLVIGIVCIRSGSVLGKYAREVPRREVFQSDEEFKVALKDYKSLRHLITVAYVVGVWCFVYILSMIGFVFIMSDFISNF